MCKRQSKREIFLWPSRNVLSLPKTNFIFDDETKNIYIELRSNMYVYFIIISTLLFSKKSYKYATTILDVIYLTFQEMLYMHVHH
jgi:hypothetical protein